MKQYKINKTLVFYLCATLLLAGIIFYFSSQPANESSQTSGIFLEILINIFGTFMPENLLEFIIRKMAHMTIYFLLGWSMTNMIGQLVIDSELLKRKALDASEKAIVRKQIYRMGFFSLLLCFLYACSDEWHQTFVPGRDGSFRDVGIDGIGFCCAILLVALWKGRIYRRREEKE